MRHLQRMPMQAGSLTVSGSDDQMLWRTARSESTARCCRLEQQGDADGSFASLADTIMQQLLSKDVLYQPMKDIGSKYPGWLAAHRYTTHVGPNDSLPAISRDMTTLV